MRNRLIQLAAISVLMVGCKAGKNYQGMEVTFPDKYKHSEGAAEQEMVTMNIDSIALDSALNIDWFSIYNDYVLDTLVKRGLRNNQDLAIAAENIVQARSALTIQRSQMLPSFGYSAGVRGGTYALNELPETTSIFHGFGTVSWELDFWGKYRRLNESAKANILASEYGYASVRVSLISTIAITYFQLLEYRKRLEISERTLALRDSMLIIIQARFDKGIIPEIDVNQAQIQRAIAAAEVPVARRLIVQTENLLSNLIGEIPTEIRTGIDLDNQSLDIMVPEGLPSQLLVRRPDIIVAVQNVVAQNALIGAAVANRLPNISLTGLLGVAGTDLSTFAVNGPAWRVGGTLLGPIFNWGAIERQIDIEESRYAQTVLQFDKTVITAFSEVENTLNDIATLKEELVVREDHVRAAARALTLSQERYNQGVTSYLEYLESQRQAFESELLLANTKQQILSSYARLYQVLGGGW